jgi:hypothetical protein
LTGTSPPLAAGYYDDGDPANFVGNAYLSAPPEFGIDSITVQDNFYSQSQQSPYWGNFLVRPPAVPDFDLDGVADTLDNCLESANPAQDDTDGDDCGNLCDADYDQDGVVDMADFNVFRRCVSSPLELCKHVEPVSIPLIGIADFNYFRSAFLGTPGPSGTTAGTLACP